MAENSSEPTAPPHIFRETNPRYGRDRTATQRMKWIKFRTSVESSLGIVFERKCIFFIKSF